MFTGIVSSVGRVHAVQRRGMGARLHVRAPRLGVVARGASVSVAGTCLTALQAGRNALHADLSPETLRRTTLGGLEVGDPVNLEKPLRAGDEIGGHYVTGHVDAVGAVTHVAREGENARVTVAAPKALRRFIAEKGSIAVDGVSLTVADVKPESFTVWTIPHTRAVTTLGRRAVGDRVNLECDLLGKYIERLLEERGAVT